MKKIVYIIGLVISMIICWQNVFADTTYMEGMGDVGIGNCENVYVVFVRGSGAVQDSSSEHMALANAAVKYASKYHISTMISDLIYPAAALDSPQKLFQAFISAGRAYEFGESVANGVRNLVSDYEVRVRECPDEKWVLVGYSQGAMVVSRALHFFDANQVAFVMLLGDPETYLPEGAGLFPDACFNKNLSSWRDFVPNCRTHKGIFGGRNPYELSGFEGKYSLWCSRNDYICGSSKNPLINSGHTTYASSGVIQWGYSYLAKKHLDGYFAPESSLRSKSVVADDYSALGELVDDGEMLGDASSDVSYEIVGGVMYLKWNPPNNAKYLLIRLNGFDLGYVDAEIGEFEIRDIDESKQNDLFVAWMAEDGEFCEGNIAQSIDADKSVVALINEPIYPSVSEDESSIITNVVPVVSTFNDGDILSSITSPFLDNSFPGDNKSAISSSRRSISYEERFNFVKIILAIFGASGLLLAFILRHRRG